MFAKSRTLKLISRAKLETISKKINNITRGKGNPCGKNNVSNDHDLT